MCTAIFFEILMICTNKRNQPINHFWHQTLHHKEERREEEYGSDNHPRSCFCGCTVPQQPLPILYRITKNVFYSTRYHFIYSNIAWKENTISAVCDVFCRFGWWCWFVNLCLFITDSRGSCGWRHDSFLCCLLKK